jgi:hypothetical protein
MSKNIEYITQYYSPETDALSERAGFLSKNKVKESKKAITGALEDEPSYNSGHVNRSALSKKEIRCFKN